MSMRRLPAGALARLARRWYFRATDTPHYKVAILGANGGTGQPLSLMLKRSAFVGQLALYDVGNTKGLRADLSHINTQAVVQDYVGADELPECLADSSVVVMVAGTPRQPGMHRDDLFETNANTVAELTAAVADNCPQAHLCIITSPVNSVVALAAEVLKRRGVYNPRRLYGITSLDSVRANVLLAQLKGVPLEKVSVPVVGGHSANSIVPLFSQARPRVRLSREEVAQLTQAVRTAADTVVAAKAGGGSATLSVAAAVHHFVQSILSAMDGKQNVIVNTFVESGVTEVPFFASPVLLGRYGIEKNLGLGVITDFEQKLVDGAVKELRDQITKGQEFARSH